jgi:hypothetical protein
MSTGFNHEWQQVSHTSQPENVWLQTFELLNSPQFKGSSHVDTEAPVTTERDVRAARAKKVVASFMVLWSCLCARWVGYVLSILVGPNGASLVHTILQCLPLVSPLAVVHDDEQQRHCDALGEASTPSAAISGNLPPSSLIPAMQSGSALQKPSIALRMPPSRITSTLRFYF